eukprot:3938963-Rhodomonas_salina.1
MEENGIVEMAQEGGRKYSSTMRQLQRLQWQLADAPRCKQKLYALWIDTSNAFASVNHEVIWSILEAYGLSAPDVSFLRSIFHGSRFSIAGPFGQTAELYTHAG